MEGEVARLCLTAPCEALAGLSARPHLCQGRILPRDFVVFFICTKCRGVKYFQVV